MDVNPEAIPETMTRQQLEWWCLFTICVAGKSARQTRKKLNTFLEWSGDYDAEHGDVMSPFEIVKMLVNQNGLDEELRRVKIGQYGRIGRAFRGVIELDVDYLTVEKLEAVPGIGPKSARMIVLYSQPNAEVVPLDTHILKYLRALGYPDVPKDTPPAGKLYKLMETHFREEARYQEKSVRELDTEVWLQYSTKKEDDFEIIARSRSKLGALSRSDEV